MFICTYHNYEYVVGYFGRGFWASEARLCVRNVFWPLFFLFWSEFVLGFASIGVGQIVTIKVDHLLGRVHISSPKLIFNFMTIMIMMMIIIIILIITNNDDHFVAWLCFCFLCFAVKLHFATTLIVSLSPPLVLCKMLSMFSPHWVPLQPTNQPTTVAQCANFE